MMPSCSSSFFFPPCDLMIHRSHETCVAVGRAALLIAGDTKSGLNTKLFNINSLFDPSFNTMEGVPSSHYIFLSSSVYDG